MRRAPSRLMCRVDIGVGELLRRRAAHRCTALHCAARRGWAITTRAGRHKATDHWPSNKPVPAGLEVLGIGEVAPSWPCVIDHGGRYHEAALAAVRDHEHGDGIGCRFYGCGAGRNAEQAGGCQRGDHRTHARHDSLPGAWAVSGGVRICVSRNHMGESGSTRQWR